MRKVLFDHCVPDPLKNNFRREIKAEFARTHGLERTRNSELEKKAYELGYDALITIDTDFGEKEHPPEYYLPVFLLRAFPYLAASTLSVLVPRIKGKLPTGPEPGLYVWDFYKTKIRHARSLGKSDEMRKEIDIEREAEIEAIDRRSR